MAYTNPSTWVAGEVLTAAQLNQQVRDNIKSLAQPPSVRVRRDVVQSIDSGTYDTIQFDTEDWDTNTMWSSTNNDQVFVRTAGKYFATFQAVIPGTTAGGTWGAAIAKNSTALTDTDDAFEVALGIDTVAIAPRLSVSGMFSLTTSDFLTAQVFHNTGSAQNTSTALRFQPKLAVIWMSS